MRHLLLADLHLRNFNDATLSPEGHNGRLVRLLDGLTDIVRAQAPLDSVTICGDTWDNKESLPTDLIFLVHQVFNSWKTEGLTAEIVILLGNHDAHHRSGRINALTQFSSFCTVITEPTIHHNIAFSPWRPSVAEIEDDVTALAESGAKYLIGHWPILGASTGSAPLESGISPNFPAFEKFERVLLGDVHSVQTISSANLKSTIQYLGSVQQNSFSEEKEDKFVWTLDTGTNQLTAIATDFPRFRTCVTVAEAEQSLKEGFTIRIKAPNRQTMIEGIEAGFRTEADFVEGIGGADNVRGFVSSLEEATTAFLIANDKENLLDLGLSFLSEAIGGQTVPAAKLVFKRVHAENFLSYAVLDLDLTRDRGMVIVNGQVLSDQSFDSNGAGKTALYESIFYALFGLTLRYGHRRDSTKREGQPRNLVELELDVVAATGQTQSLKICRARPGTLELWIDGIDATKSSSDLTQDAITQLVGNDQYFLRLTLLAPHYHTSFVQISDAEKKKLIDSFLGLENFQTALKQVSDEISRLDLDHQRLTFEKTRFSDQQIILEKHLEDAQNELAEFNDREQKAKQARADEIAGISKELAELSPPPVLNLPTDFTKPPAPRKPVLEDPAPIKEQIAQDEVTIDAIRPMLQSFKDQRAEQQRPFVSRIAVVTSQILQTLESKKSESCLTCNRPFENVEEHNRHLDLTVEKLAKEKASLEERLAKKRLFTKEKVDSFESELQGIEDDIRIKRKRLDAIRGAEATYQGQMQSYERALAKTEMTFTNHLNLLRATYENQLAQYQSQVQRLQDSIASLRRVQPGDNSTICERIQSTQSDLDVLEVQAAILTEKIAAVLKAKADHEFLSICFGNRGAKSLLYTSLLDRLNQELLSVCNAISGGTLRLRLLPSTENAKGEFIEKISLEVKNLLGAASFFGDSLGEQNRINLAVSLALRRVLKTFAGYSSSLFFADEPFQGLDGSGKRSIYAVLEEEAKEALVLVTDQDPQSKGSSNADVWTVRKANGISVLL